MLVIHSWNVKWWSFFKRQPWWFAHFLKPITGSITHRRRKKKYCLRRSEWKKKKFDKGRAIFHYQHNTELKVVRLGKSSLVHTIQQMFQEKFHLAICVSYFFPFFRLPNWLYRIKCEGIIKSLCNYLLNIQREFHRSCFSSKTKRKFYKLY